MAVIRATCPDCGDVDLGVTDVCARVCIDNECAEYRFTCPVCASIIVKRTSDENLDLLLDLGVELEEWHLPDELFEPHPGPMISHRDVVEFYTALADDDAFTSAIDSLID